MPTSPTDLNAQTWYHGSPFELVILRAGSAITQDIRLAAVFAHKPTLVSIEDDGRIRHNGAQPGWLYQIAEPLLPGDVTPHPRSSMPPGLEWLTTRDLRLALSGPVVFQAGEQLTEDEAASLRRKMTP